MLLCVLSWAPQGFSQNDKNDILSLRMASNKALKAYDQDKVLSFLTDDVLITTGNGTLLSGKKDLSRYIASAGPSKMYWVRTPSHIEINESLGLAWETGTWEGFNPEEGIHALVRGNYAAMWTKLQGEWKIKSQLFVSLP